MRIWYPRPQSEEVLRELEALAPGHTISREPAEDTEMLIEGRVERAHLMAAPRLKWVVVPFAGVPRMTLDLLLSWPQISLHNLHHNAPHTAETALALLLAAAKQTVPADQAMRRNDWTARYQPDRAVLLRGKTCLLLGYGEVGKRIGDVLRAMGMEVLAVRRHPREGAPEEFPTSELPSLLPKADVLIITVPATEETEAMIGPEELALLPAGAILVNVARAQVVEERGLYEALKSGRLHSAGLDVWYRYPQASPNSVPSYFEAPPSAVNTPPSRFPFHELPTLVMSPHRGGAAAGSEALRVRHLADLIHAAANGEDVPNKVRLHLGY